MLGSEGGKLTEGRLELLRAFYRLGLRHLQQSWAYGNRLTAGEVEVEDSRPLEATSSVGISRARHLVSLPRD
jgi:microsomal dipeptidase-like Zn-dependent dipeptidase